MDDLISRQEALDAIDELVSTMSVCVCVEECRGMNWMKHRAIAAIEALPTAERVGKWMTKHPYRDDFGQGVRLDLRFRYPSCSNCGAVFGCEPYYCPNCGSKMMNGTEWLDWDSGYGVQEGEGDEQI